jgi:cation diffusion facilitator CzcD-associated flavoprotein CzcO
MTLVPAMAARAGHVTMLQRSPTYVVSAPARDPLADWMRDRLPSKAVYGVTRWKNVLLGMAFYAYCRRRPEQAKKLLVGQVRRQMRGVPGAAAHFTPSYNPWDQRVCLVPDGDLFEVLRQGRASVVTDQIDRFVEGGIALRSGETIAADIIVTATGLNMKFLGGMEVEVDGERVEPSETMLYKGCMLSDVPNLALALGYTNASWTLKCDLTAEYVCRLLRHMEGHGYTQARPRRDPEVKAEPILSFTSGYIQRSIGKFPRQGSAAPWRVYQNYAIDRVAMTRGKLDDRALTVA